LRPLVPDAPSKRTFSEAVIAAAVGCRKAYEPLTGAKGRSTAFLACGVKKVDSAGDGSTGTDLFVIAAEHGSDCASC
jgi:hypothetical protein